MKKSNTFFFFFFRRLYFLPSCTSGYAAYWKCEPSNFTFISNENLSNSPIIFSTKFTRLKGVSKWPKKIRIDRFILPKTIWQKSSVKKSPLDLRRSPRNKLFTKSSVKFLSNKRNFTGIVAYFNFEKKIFYFPVKIRF